MQKSTSPVSRAVYAPLFVHDFIVQRHCRALVNFVEIFPTDEVINGALEDICNFDEGRQ